MKPRLLLILSIMVLAPLALLAALGAWVAAYQREEGKRVFQKQALSDLQVFDDILRRFMDTRERELLQITQLPSSDAAAIRERIREHPTVSQIFCLDAGGNLVHPAPRGEWTAQERSFISRTADLWVDKDLLYHAAGDAAPASQPSQAAQSPTPAQGWRVWHYGKGFSLLFWRLDEAGRVVGAELDGTRLLADLIGQLPDTKPDDREGAAARLALVDEAGATVYQWGAYEPPAGETPRATLRLSYPLTPLRLDYYAPEAFVSSASRGSMIIVLGAGLAFVAVALIGLAAYFYRESSREMREAAQRVTFVNQVSHELKTPLTNVRMYAELLQGGLADDDEANRRRVDVIVSESQRLSRLIANILAFSRRQRNRLSLHPTDGVVDAVVRRVIEQFRPSMEAKGIAIALDAGADGIRRFDSDALEQIIGNLFSNVEKYAAAGGAMNVTTRARDGRIVITVSDRGPGIPPRQRERIFEPFTRLDDSLTAGAAGTGIGLTIARDLARLHGGDLRLVDSAEGARFEAVFLCERAEPDRDSQRNTAE